MNKISLLAALVALSIVPLSMAVTPGGASVNTISSASYSGSTAGTVSVTAGSIQEANLTAKQSTYYWAGLFGNATGQIVLGDNANNQMFVWNAVGVAVYAAVTNAIDWVNPWSTANCTDMDNSFTYLQNAHSDSCANTFTANDSFSSVATGQSVTNTSEAITNDNTGTAYWKTMIVKDANGNIIFISPVDQNGHAAYNGTTAEYQMILPEDGSNGNTQATQYYLWVELQ